jgi:DNA-binding CsgD family transcriptional regulator
MTKLEVLVDAVDHSYNSRMSDPEWLRAMLEVLAPELDRGYGLCTWFYDASDLANLRLFHPTSLGVRDGTLEAIFASASHPEVSQEVLEKHWATPAGAVSELLGDAADDFVPWRETIFRLGIRDIVTINAYDVDGRGMAVNAFCPQRVHLSQEYIEQLERVAAHLIAAFRIRRDTRPVEAVFAPDGAVLHAEGEATAKTVELSAAARSIGRARGPLRKTSPEEALSAWRALVDARWSLVDFIDTDGKRFLVARVNDLKTAEASKLTTRERQIVALIARGHSNKLIGYELGIAEGTVGAHVSSAMRRLGVANRRSLVAVYAGSSQSSGGELDSWTKKGG